jgi:hypothetical protein
MLVFERCLLGASLVFLFFLAMGKKAKQSEEYLALEKAYLKQQEAHARTTEFSEMMEKGWQQCAIEKDKLQEELNQYNLAGDLAAAQQRLECQKQLMLTLKRANVDLEDRLYASMLENLALKQENAAVQVKYSEAQEATKDFKDAWLSTRDELRLANASLLAKQTLLDEERDCTLKSIRLIDRDVTKKEHELTKLTEAYNKLLLARSGTREACTNTELPPSKEDQATDVLGLLQGKELAVQADLARTKWADWDLE